VLSLLVASYLSSYTLIVMQSSAVKLISSSDLRFAPFKHGQTLPALTRKPIRRSKHADMKLNVTRANGLQNMINQLSEAVTNSPVNNLKKGIAKVQAGDYDETATRAKVDGYLKENPVSMVFFVVVIFTQARLHVTRQQTLAMKWLRLSCSVGLAVHSARMPRLCLIARVQSTPL